MTRGETTAAQRAPEDGHDALVRVAHAALRLARVQREEARRAVGAHELDAAHGDAVAAQRHHVAREALDVDHALGVVLHLLALARELHVGEVERGERGVLVLEVRDHGELGLADLEQLRDPPLQARLRV